MASPIVPPRRREEFFNPDGTFTLRALRFFEELTDNTNINTDDNELADIAVSPAQLAGAIKQLRDLELQPDNTAMLAAIIKRLLNLELEQDNNSAAALPQVFKRLNDIELQIDNTAMLSTVFKRLSDLELTQEPQSTAGVNTAIKSTFDRRYALLVS